MEEVHSVKISFHPRLNDDGVLQNEEEQVTTTTTTTTQRK